jgi:beta-glucosidase
VSWIEQTLGEMTLAEKIGQMTQVSCDSITPAEVADLGIGSVLSGGNGNPSPNTPAVWFDMVGSFVEASEASRLGVPLVYGVDAVHGHSNVGGATIFPHNIGLGAAGDERLVERIGRATAEEMLATGVRWTFAPTVAVPGDIRWGRTYEGYGREPALVARLGSALIAGLQGDDGRRIRVLACPKHFVGDGGTEWGSVARPTWVHWWDGWGDNWQIDQGETKATEDELQAIHLPPYRAAIQAGALTMMASYSSWNGDKLHGHRRLLGDVLKKELDFPGFVVSDWMAVDQLHPAYRRSVVTAVNAGIDMVMVPFDFRRFIDVTLAAVRDGEIAMARIDDAVGRILRAKAALGFDDVSPPRRPSLSAVGSEEHRSLAAEAARRSAVLLHNDGAALPIENPPVIEVAGEAADDIGLQCGGWTVGWQGAAGPVTAGTTLLTALRAAVPCPVRFDASGSFPDAEPADVGIVCVAEAPYAEGLGDAAIPAVRVHERAVFERLRQRCRRLVLVVMSGRPLVMPDLIEQADAVVAVWLPGSEATQLPDLLLGRAEFEGTLPQPWPRTGADLDDPAAPPLYAVGHGLRLRPHAVPTSKEPGT